jgi:hypothetical protein
MRILNFNRKAPGRHHTGLGPFLTHIALALVQIISLCFYGTVKNYAQKYLQTRLNEISRQ